MFEHMIEARQLEQLAVAKLLPTQYFYQHIELLDIKGLAA
jgi:hypothetical protein